MSRFNVSDELGNNWSPTSYKETIHRNVLRTERAFTHFDFTLMTRAEVYFLQKLANGENPYPPTASKLYVNRGPRKVTPDWEYEQLKNPKILQNTLNWAP